MAGFRVNWGIKDLERQLGKINQYDAATQDKLRSAVRTSTENIMVGAKRRAPVRSGKLVKGIKMTYNSTKNEGIVHAKSPHAHLVEFGHKGGVEFHNKKKALHGGRLTGFANKVNIPAVSARPFLRPAFEDEKPNLIKNVKDAVKP